MNPSVQNSINFGVTYAVAAGNSNLDACTQSPARVGAAITDFARRPPATEGDARNQGRCRKRRSLLEKFS
jgi:hypothetical protein